MNTVEGVGYVALFCKLRQCSSRESIMKGVTDFYWDLDPAQIFRTETNIGHYNMFMIHVNFSAPLVSTQSRVCSI